MSRLRRTRGEQGFSLVEILVAITIFGIVATAVLPLLLAGIRGGTHAKLTTQAKNLGQQRLELMRNLPFYVAQQNGDYRDVLDVYFRDLANPGTVAAGDPCASRRYESGSRSYVCVVPSTVIGGATFSQTVRSSFSDAAGAVVTPRTDYDSRVVNRDAPAANLLKVEISTTWTQGELSRDFVLRSSIANSATDDPLITSKLSASAVKVVSTATSGAVLQFEAGILGGDGSKSTASSADGTAVGAYASLDAGATITGAEAVVSAPVDEVLPSPLPSGAALALNGSDCSQVCFGDTAITGAAAAKVSDGFPELGIDNGKTYMGAELSRGTGLGLRGFEYSNTTLTAAQAALGVTALPLVSAGTGLAGPVVDSRGSMTAVSTGTTSVTTTVRSSVQAVQLFRTTLAPAGLVKVALDHAQLTCVDGGTTPGVTASWAATVSVHTPTGYVDYPIGPGSGALPPLSTPTSSGLPLSHYISSWSALGTAASSVGQAVAGGFTGSIPSVVNILSTATRAGDATSALNVTVGSLSCTAVDNQ